MAALAEFERARLRRKPQNSLCRFSFCLVDTLITANGDLFSADCYLDSAIGDLPITDGTFYCVHIASNEFEIMYESRPFFIHASYSLPELSRYQILAHFAQGISFKFCPDLGWRHAKLASEHIGKMTVA